MSGAGRGSPRVSPPVGSLPQLQLADASASQTARLFEVTNAPWGYQLSVAGDPFLLNPAEAAYMDGSGEVNFRVPYGAIRGAIVGTYTPEQAGGQLGVQIRWGQITQKVFSTVNVPAINYGPAGSLRADAERYQDSMLTPPSGVQHNFVLPFWVPPVVSPLIVSGGPFLNMIFMVREAGTGGASTVLINQVFAENFGLAMPVART